MSEKNECLIKLRDQAKILTSKTYSEIKFASQEIIDSINNKLNDDNSWQIFEIQFNKANPDFFKNLLSTHSELSFSELRICALLKLGLNTKQISLIMNLSERTIENHRLSIRKKIIIDKSNSLISYLHSF